MKHLSDDQLLCLAMRINREEELSYREALQVEHIGCCDTCYELLRCMMALMTVTDHADMIPQREEEKIPDNRVEIKMVIMSPMAVLEQLYAQQSQWVFDAPPPHAFAGTRSGKKQDSEIVKLEDIDNSLTFVAYHPSEKALVIRLDCEPGESAPRVFLKSGDGTRREIPLEREGRMYWAKINGLKQGEYQITLEL